jgi:hypothetical protein
MGLLNIASAKEQASSSQEPSRTESIKKTIEKFNSANGAFFGTVLQSKEGDSEFFKKIETALAASGVSVDLGAGSCLILLPRTEHIRLILHRLSQSFGASVTLSFESPDVQGALEYIQPYIS